MKCERHVDQIKPECANAVARNQARMQALAFTPPVTAPRSRVASPTPREDLSEHGAVCDPPPSEDFQDVTDAFRDVATLLRTSVKQVMIYVRSEDLSRLAPGRITARETWDGRLIRQIRIVVDGVIFILIDNDAFCAKATRAERRSGPTRPTEDE